MKHIRYIITAVTAIVFFLPKLHAQDPNFSQFFTSPMTLNPALIGKGVSDWRAIALYRTQWFGNTGSHPYITSTVSLEKRLITATRQNDQLSMGLMLLSDESNGGLLKNNFAAAGIAYHNALDNNEKRLLSSGITVSYRNRILDPSKFTFQSQFGSGGYQPEIGQADGVNIPRAKYLDVNAGIQLSDRQGNTGYTIGVSYFHAARPGNGAYVQNEVAQNPRLSVQGSIEFLLKNKHELSLSAVANMQGGGVNDLFTLGAMYKIPMNENGLELRNLSIGLWNRTKESINGYAAFEFNSNWLLGISYDIILTDIKTSYNSLQSMEFSLAWQFAGKKRKSFLSQQTSVIPFY